MSWNYDEALDRAKRRYEETAELTVTDVVQEIDFDKISRLHPRRVTGTHLYADVSNFNTLLRDADAEGAENLLLRLHIFAREASKIIGSDFEGCKVHFQGPRVHALAYRPVSDESAMTAKAILTTLALRHAITLFNDVFKLTDVAPWRLAAGLDHGTAIATRNGASGDQELLFLGNPANYAAKILRDSGGIRMTPTVHDLLPASFDDYLSASTADDAWHVKMSAEKVTELAAGYGWTWSLEKTRKRLEEAADQYPTGSLKVSGVKEKIDKTSLGVSHTKRVDGASIFADVDGFTGYIDRLSSEGDDLIEAARAFHVLRGVMRDTAVRDFDALRVQYQGDRMQSLAYLPLDDEQQAALDAVKLAAALNSVADLVVPEVVDPAAAKRLAIGLAWGEVLVSKIGEHNHRDVVSIGPSTSEAASVQQRLEGGTIGVSSALHNLLTGSVRDAFSWDANAKAWVVKELQYDDLMQLIQSDDPQRALGVVTGAVANVAAIGAAALIGSRGDQREEPLKPWHQD